MITLEHNCTIGNYIMVLFQGYIDNLNRSNVASLEYNELKNFKAKKATQAELARLLGDDKPLSKTTLSGYITGTSPIPLEIILKLNSRLHLKSEAFIKLVDLYVRQNPELLTVLSSEENGSAIKDASLQINSILINTFTLKLLFEISKSKYPEDLEILYRYELHEQLKEITEKIFSLYVKINSETKNVAKLILG